MGRKTKHQKQEDLLSEVKRTMKKHCPMCGKRIHFYAFEKTDKQLCEMCGKYVFKDKKSEYDYRMNELLKRQRREK